jgi:nitrilase
MTSPANIKVAVTQAEPIWLDLQSTVTKTITLIKEAASNNAILITFPECWIPGYPAWIWYSLLSSILSKSFLTRIRSRPVDFDMVTRYTKNSLKIDSSEMGSICAAAAKNKIAVCLGFSENLNNSLYISQAIIDTQGEIRIQRRKLKPTHMERTVFGDSTGGGTLNNVAEIEGVGKVSALACWEHCQPLLKYHTCTQTPDIHVAAWPPLYSHAGGPSLYSMSRDGCRSLSRTFAIESQAFVLHTTAVLSQAGIDQMGTNPGLMNKAGGGSSAIFGPDGRLLSVDLPETEEGILYADLDFDEILRAKSFLDICGHYSRPDLLWLGVDDRKKVHRRGPEVALDEKEVEV